MYLHHFEKKCKFFSLFPLTLFAESQDDIKHSQFSRRVSRFCEFGVCSEGSKTKETCSVFGCYFRYAMKPLNIMVMSPYLLWEFIIVVLCYYGLSKSIFRPCLYHNILSRSSKFVTEKSFNLSP